jgi:hypothetical protein
MTSEQAKCQQPVNGCRPAFRIKGWACVEVTDNEDQDFVCEMCEVVHIRFLHHMEHPNYDESLRVGCICAGNMEGDYVGAKRRESEFKSRQKRRDRLLSRDWRVSASGNDYINVGESNIVVFPKGPYWGARVAHRVTGECQFLSGTFASANGAKRAALKFVLEP